MDSVFALFLTLSIGTAPPQIIVSVLESTLVGCEAERLRVRDEIRTHQELADVITATGSKIKRVVVPVDFNSECVALR